jgi:thiamine pyrophosphokinase
MGELIDCTHHVFNTQKSQKSKSMFLLNISFIPDLIVGDLDSAITDHLHFYERLGTKVIPIRDQDSTDVQKALSFTKPNDNIILVGGGGNLSQEIGNLNTLFDYSDRWVSLWTPQNWISLLRPGVKYNITLQRHTKVALIPIGFPCRTVTTTGLKWNLSKIFAILTRN